MRQNGQLLVGSSSAFRSLQADLALAARGSATVLLFGESGTGKGAAAAEIHRASPRAGGPFVVVHLGAVAPTLIESELFGHERGAFTDAVRAREGCFRRAQGGTLVLDDVDLLPRDAQVKLLRVLQERVVEPVGAEAAVPIDVRVVAISGVDLRAEVEAGRFRQDLYWRLAVVSLELPPLRARTGDLPLLAEALLERIAQRAHLPARPISAGALERLGAHAWPGNVRELENALERVLALPRAAAGGDPLPIEAGEFDFLAESLAGAGERIARSALAQGLTVDGLALAMLRTALAENRGNVSAAARQVGLTRRAFEYRLAQSDGAPSPPPSAPEARDS